MFATAVLHDCYPYTVIAHRVPEFVLCCLVTAMIRTLILDRGRRRVDHAIMPDDFGSIWIAAMDFL